MGQYRSFVDVLRERAIRQPDRPAYTFLTDGEVPEARLTYGGLDAAARAVAARLQSAGACGERVLLLYPAGLEYVAAFYGCLYAGAVAVPAYPPRRNRSLQRLQAVAADAQAGIALTTSHVYDANESAFGDAPALRTMRWLVTDRSEAGEAAADDWREQPFGGERLAFLQYTSGSTATPRGVMVSHANLLHNQRVIRQVFGQSEESVVVGWLPLYHDMGLIGNVLQPLYVGASCFLMSPAAFLQKPSRWLRAISTYGATTSGGPNFAYDLCARRATPELLASIDLSGWTTAFNGAEPVRHETLERFAAAFEPCGFKREAFQPCYGLAEATLLVAGSPKGRGAVVGSFSKAALASDEVVAAEGDEAAALVSCGAGPADQQVVVVDPKSSAPAAPGRVGEIWVSGPSVARGYWNRPEETARTFQATLAETGQGPFLRTGDLGFFHRGELFVTGRLKDLVIIRGLNHYPQDIELTVEQSHAALRPGAGAVFSVDEGGEERLVVVQELNRRGADLQEVAGRVREAVTREHEAPVYAVVLIRKHSLPKTSSGKVQRNLCRSKFLAGELEAEFVWREERPPDDATGAGVAEAPRGPLDPASLEAWLKAELAAVLGVGVASIDASRPLTGYGLDSLRAVELTHKIASRLGVVVPATSVIQDMSVAGLAAQILSGAADSTTPPCPAPAPAGEVGAEHPLSYGQQGLWFLQQLAPQSAAYNIAFPSRVDGDLDAAALRRALQRLAERHASLRTTFDATEGQPVQRVRERAEIFFQEEEVSAPDEAALRERLHGEVARPFDLGRDALLRAFLFKSSARSGVLLLVVHHIVADMWSLSILMRELGELYREETGGAPARLAPLRLQYTDYARWQVATLDGPEGERLWEYWRRQLSGELPALSLPADARRPQSHLSRKGAEPFRVGRELLDRLKAVGGERGATLYVTLLAAFQTLLFRYTGQEDILVGSPTANRARAELAGMVGFLMNLLVLRADLSGNPTFEELLGRTRLNVLEALKHQEYPFPLLVQRLHPERDPGRAPLVQAVFNLRSADDAAPGRLKLGGATLEPFLMEPPDAQFDLTLVAVETTDGLTASFEYNAELFTAETVGRLASHFKSLLASVAQHPRERVARLRLFPDEERGRLLERGARAATHVPDLAAHHLFEAQAARTPEAAALRFQGASLTYAQLNRRAEALAGRLRRLGVGPETLVGLLLERSPELLTALLAVLKCGGAYVPLDPHMPPPRLALMLEDAGLGLLVTQRELRHLGQARDGVAGPRVIDVEETEWDGAASAGGGQTRDGRQGWRDRLAYVIYTSGSTGRPKGVQITHGAVVNFLQSMSRRPGVSGEDLVLALTPLSFDIAVLELLLPLAVGGCVELVSREVAGDGAALRAHLQQTRPTVMQATPATWRMLIESGWEGSRQLKALCGGEALASELAAELSGRVASLWNMYGPTETTIWSSAAEVGPAEVSRGSVVELGEAVDNTRLYVLDAAMEPVPQGVTGELLIGGAGLARGYLRAPSLTARSFIPDPFSREPGARLYRTGDLVRNLPHGGLQFVGRRDHQVKLRGHRLELGEIEAVLRGHPSVSDCAVVLRGASGPQGPRLVAYVVGSGPDEATDEQELRAYARGRLPDYMRPAAYVRLDALPLTPHGKLDRARLPGPPPPAPGAAGAEPRTEFERVVAGAWAEVLGRARVGAGEDFFEAGGHSLLAARLAGRLRARCGAAVSVRDVFEHPTVAALASLIADRQGQEAPQHQAIKRADRLDTRQMLERLDELSDEEMASLLNSLSRIG